jgi:PmbA protein
MDLETQKKSLAQCAQKAVELAVRQGADQAEAGVSYDEGLSVAVRMGELESVERQKDRGLAVTVYKDQRKGSATTSDFSDAAIETTVAKAISIARFTAPDEFAGLADAELMARTPPDLDLCHSWDVDVRSAEKTALRTEDAARSFDARIENSEGASVSSGVGVRAYANSHGFVGAYGLSSHSIGCSVVAKNGSGSLERDYWYSAARSAGELEGAEAIGAHAAKRAVARLGARQLSTRVVPVLFVAELARGLFGHFVAAIRGTSQYRKASFLLDCLGEQIFPEWLCVTEDPHIPRAMASAPFDSEGVATSRRELIENGIVRGYVLSSYSARRLSMRTTGNAGGAHNLVVASTAGTLEDIVAGLDSAFVVTELLGQGANTVTGDYSRGAAGYWVERGEPMHAVSEVTVAGNLRDMFRNVVLVGSDVDLRGTVRCGSVLVDGLTVAGQ